MHAKPVVFHPAVSVLIDTGLQKMEFWVRRVSEYAGSNKWKAQPRTDLRLSLKLGQ